MNAILHLPRLFWAQLMTDRVVQAGTSTSTVSLWGSYTISHAQAWLGLFAAFFGGLSAAATFVYVCIKIRRLVANPKAVE